MELESVSLDNNMIDSIRASHGAYGLVYYGWY